MSKFIDGYGNEISIPPELDNEARQQAFMHGWAKGEELNNAIWEATWFAVQCHCDKAQFVAVITRAANEAFDSQVRNAAVKAHDREGKT